MKTSEQEIFLIEKLNKKGRITNWHFNDDFLEFCDKFYPDMPLKYCRAKLSYYMRKLVKSGIAESSIKLGVGYGNGSLYGVNHQTYWDKKV